jgi:N-acetylmuramoyl-L-alanine amidase
VGCNFLKKFAILSWYCLVLLAGLALLPPAESVAAATDVKNLRIWYAPDHTRIVFDLGGPVSSKVFMLDNPQRLVVDIDSGNLVASTPSPKQDNSYISAIRTGAPSAGVLRFVFDLKQRVTPNDFQLDPNSEYGHRLVVDLQAMASAAPIGPVVSAPSVGRDRTPPPPDADRRFVVAIDAGHGGEDPGAKGRRGTREKTLTLQIASELHKVINRDPKMEAFLVRTGDYFIKLRGRTDIARRKNADIFISIHADAFKSSSVRGFGVFALSERGASSETANWLANKENSADLIGGVSLKDKDDLLAEVLLDLSMTKTINDSLTLGNSVLQELTRIGKPHRKRVEQARFVVLKSPDIPSILIEAGFITNADDENNLRSSKYQRKLAESIHGGVARYFKSTPYSGAAVASNSPSYTVHKVASGDTLSGIASRYGVSMAVISSENRLKNNVVKRGQSLRIPLR